MKHTLIFTLSFFIIATLMSACSTGQVADEMAVVGNPSLSSNPCVAIDKKVMKLDRFTEVVKNTSAFHLEEKASAISTPGITVSNNRKKMLKEAEKKYAEYEAERRKYGCESPEITGTDQTIQKLAILDQCTAIDQKVMRLNRFTQVVKNTSAFHLEEKASAIPTPGITVSNNRKKMLKDAEKKYVEYAAEHKKYGCDTPISADNLQTVDKMEVVSKSSLSDISTVKDNESIKSHETTTKVSNTTAVPVAALPVAKTTVSNNKKEMVVAAEKKDVESSTVRKTSNVVIPIAPATTQMDEKTTASDYATFSSEKCNALDEELIALSEFTSMVKNTSAFHLEEKASALPSPGFTVSNNKKKMLRDIEKRHSELSKERKKYGCDPL